MAGTGRPQPLAAFTNALLLHQAGTAEEPLLDLRGGGWKIFPGDFIGLHAGGTMSNQFYHELGAWLQGLRTVAEGEFRMFGRPAPLPPEWSARTARVFREGGFVPELTVRGNIDLALAFSGLSPRERAERVDEALERFSLSAYRDRHPGTDAVGRGAEKRLNYARAWARRPAVLFIDLPFLHIRDQYGEQIARAVSEILAAGGAVVFASNREQDLLAGGGNPDAWRPNRRFVLRRGGRLGDFACLKEYT